MTTTTNWATTTDDLRLLARGCQSGHLTLTDFLQALRLGIGAALDAAADDRAADTAARILACDDAARAEFGGQVDVLKGYLVNEGRIVSTRVARTDVEPFTFEELHAYCMRTKAEVEAALPPERRPRPAPVLATGADEAASAAAPAGPTLASLAKRLGFASVPDGGLREILDRRSIGLVVVDGNVRFGAGSIVRAIAADPDDIRPADRSAAVALSRDLDAFVRHHDPALLSEAIDSLAPAQRWEVQARQRQVV